MPSPSEYIWMNKSVISASATRLCVHHPQMSNVSSTNVWFSSFQLANGSSVIHHPSSSCRGSLKQVGISFVHFYVWVYIKYIYIYRSADKSLARPGGNKVQRPNSNFCKPLKKKFRSLSIQPGLRDSNDLHVGRKMATFQLFFQSGRVKDLSAPL